jgi:hypothetical protein
LGMAAPEQCNKEHTATGLSDSIGEIFYARYFAPTDVTVVAPSASVPPQC